MRSSVLILIALSTFVTASQALDADSLGGLPWQSFLRSDAGDTASGPLSLNQINWFYAKSDPGVTMMQWDNYGLGILGYNRSFTSPLMNLVNESNLQPLIELYADSNCPSLVSLHGKASNPNTNDLLVLDEISVPNGIGIGVYNGHGSGGTGIYVDHGGDHFGIRIENNEWSTGHALFLDNGNTGTALGISDVASGRIIHISQDSANKPALTLFYRGSQSGFNDDSSMFYWWGLKGHKAEVETVKTALCGLRSFAGGVLYDTVMVSGVAESTTVVTANYAGGFESTTCTPLRIKVETGAIIVKRGLSTDPNSYYWQATLMLDLGQKIDPPPPVPDNDKLGFLVYPNPSSGMSTVRYALPKADRVQLAVYNLLGQKVKTITDGWQAAGYYTVQWDGKNDHGKKAAAGIYLCRIKAAGRQETQKVAVIK